MWSAYVGIGAKPDQTDPIQLSLQANDLHAVVIVQRACSCDTEHYALSQRIWEIRATDKAEWSRILTPLSSEVQI